MVEEKWNSYLDTLISGIGNDRIYVPRGYVRKLSNSYLVRSFDGKDLRFSLPVFFSYRMPEEIYSDISADDGPVGLLIESIKKRADHSSALGVIAGRWCINKRSYMSNTEPVTVSSASGAFGSSLWMPDHNNTLLPEGIIMTVRGGIPYPGPPSPPSLKMLLEILNSLAEALDQEIRSIHYSDLIDAWELSLDQKNIRRILPKKGLVSFVGDGSSPARDFTELRCHHRIAGPKRGVSIPFECPDELEPVEIVSDATGNSYTGLGICKGEFLSIVGSNAEGKSTFVRGIVAGEDDHAAGDGRETIVTVPGGVMATALGHMVSGAEVSLFFKSLPPGLTGNPSCVYGNGSGSIIMAEQIQRALSRDSPMVLIDEDQAADNLLIPNCIQNCDVTQLSEIIMNERERLAGTTIIFAGSASDMLIANSDRILMLREHRALAVTREAFAMILKNHMERMMKHLTENILSGYEVN